MADEQRMPLQRRSRTLDYARLHEKVIALHESVRTREAQAVYRKIARDENPHALALFGRTAARYGVWSTAIELLESAIRCGADAASDWNELGLACLEAGRLEAAREHFRAAVKRDPADYRAALNIALVHQAAGDLDRAMRQLGRVAAVHPEVVAVPLRRAELQLRRGEPRAALDELDAVRGRKLHPTWPLALESVALAELEDEAAHRQLMRYDEFVQWIEVESPPGETDLPAFDQRLCSYVRGHRGLVRDPAGYSTRNGQHTLGNLLRDRSPIMDALENVIGQAVSAYLRELPAPDGHAFLERAAEFRLEARAVVLGRGGHHVSHVHRDGWLSGVYYADVSGVVGSDDQNREGWLELGLGPDELRVAARPCATQWIRPRDSGVAVFPSFYWHRTEPFTTRGRRVAIAFDVIPR
jgi:tetratricopeptide (TPR) repeat protein